VQQIKWGSVWDAFGDGWVGWFGALLEPLMSRQNHLCISLLIEGFPKVPRTFLTFLIIYNLLSFQWKDNLKFNSSYIVSLNITLTSLHCTHQGLPNGTKSVMMGNIIVWRSQNDQKKSKSKVKCKIHEGHAMIFTCKYFNYKCKGLLLNWW
jgi:hypothetical protein